MISEPLYDNSTCSPDLRFSLSGTTKLLARFTRNDLLLIERRKASGMRENFVASGAFRSGKKKFLTANILFT